MLKRLLCQGPKSLALLIQDQELVPHPYLEDQHLPQDPPQKKAGLQVRFVSVALSLLSTGVENDAEIKDHHTLHSKPTVEKTWNLE